MPLFLFLAFQVAAYLACHREALPLYGFDVHAETQFFQLGGCVFSEAGKHGVALLVVGKIVEERFSSAGGEEDYHVVVKGLALVKLHAHGAIHYAVGVLNALAVEQLGDFLVVGIS